MYLLCSLGVGEKLQIASCELGFNFIRHVGNSLGKGEQLREVTLYKQITD